MAWISIEKRFVMVARESARRDSDARVSGRSIFIKRYYGRYCIIEIKVSGKQRSCRDMFAEAQRMASIELKNWNRRRHWSREAKRHKIKGAHRMAVSYFYKVLKVEVNRDMRVLSLERGIERVRYNYGIGLSTWNNERMMWREIGNGFERLGERDVGWSREWCA
ncbi:MAG: hypothetical protein Q4C30_03320 [Bacteroidia bacterium]|nr:hypothetical protein [Bacteroidia bacterium]